MLHGASSEFSRTTAINHVFRLLTLCDPGWVVLASESGGWGPEG